MRAFSGIVTRTVNGAWLSFRDHFGQWFSRRGSLVMAHGLLMEVALLFLLISLIPLFEDPINFWPCPTWPALH